MNNIDDFKNINDNTKMNVVEDNYGFDELYVRLLLTSISCYDKCKYSVCIVCNDINKKVIYDDIMFKEFSNEEQAEEYYKFLKRNISNSYIRNLLEKI